MSRLRQEERGISVKTLCSLFGKTRHAWYDEQWRMRDEILVQEVVRKEIQEIRKVLPGVGTRKLHFLLSPILAAHHLQIGRDHLFELMASWEMQIRRRRRRAVTTDSRHWMRKYDNLIGEHIVIRADQVWVSDISAPGRCNFNNKVTPAFFLTGS